MLRKNAKIELIRRVPLFSRCTRKELDAVAGAADEIEVPAGRELATEGDRGREFCVIVSGEAAVRKGGRRIRSLGDGDFFGEIALLTGGVRTATVTTTASTRLLVVTDRAFRSLVETVPTLQSSVLRALAERLEASAL